MDIKKYMNNREEFERTAIEKGHLLALGYMSTCDWHIPVEMMLWIENGEVFCPKCYQEKQSKQLEQVETDFSLQYHDKEKKLYLVRHSIFGGRSFVGKGFKGFEAKTSVEREIREKAMNYSKKIASGEIMNVIMTGPAGSGKSHLSYSMIVNINEMSAEYNQQLSCLFVDFTSFMELILASYSETAADKKTADYYLNMMKSVDVLIIDDLGTDIGKTDTAKRASDHTYKMLFTILNAREGTKSTIISTNLTYSQLKAAYDERIASRLSTNLNILDFSLINDKRPGFGF